MKEKLSVCKPLDESILCRYDNLSLVEKYYIYIQNYRNLERKLREIIGCNMHVDNELLSSKNFGQLIRILRKNIVDNSIINILKKINNDYKKLYEIFWVDKVIANSLGRNICVVEKKVLDNALFEIDKILLNLN